MATRTVLIALTSAAVAVAACSTSTPNAGPTTITVTKPASTTVTNPASPTITSPAPAPTSSTAPAVGQDSSCEVNPSSAPVPTAEPYGPVAEVGRISVALNGIPSGVVTAGSAPTEVEVKLCNDSAVSYPEVGVVVVLAHCSCAPKPMLIPKGTVERFDPATGSWIQMEHAVEGRGMDFLGGYSNVQELPKGKSVTLRYRIALDASMTAGDGGVSATAVTPEPLRQLGRAELHFTVST